MTSDLRIGCGWDLHRLVHGRRLVLGGIDIPFEKGLQGHSDADVLLHAIIDALLGATGDADIGTHFGDTDPEWRDVSSLKLLAIVADRLREKHWVVVNIDSTVVIEAPRIAPYRERMQAVIARVLDIETACVSIKAKTAEGCGAEGGGEAVSAEAVVLVQQRPATP